MLKSLFLLAFAMLSLSPLVIPQVESPAALLATPLPPDTGEIGQPTGQTAIVEPAPIPTPLPSRLIIPSISLNDTIAKVGLNAKGEMDVPAGNTKDVGWYRAGAVPGNVGSAVIDAHVFAAFSKLKNIKIGSDIYVETDSGQRLHFVVSDLQTYALRDVPADILFNRADTERLNLITCAGNLTADHTTYDHRLVVYATLAHNS
jgi:sortase (surface protein transpeptidase)